MIRDMSRTLRLSYAAEAVSSDSQGQLVLDRVLRAVIKQLGAVSTLQQERLARCDIRQLFPQPVNFSRRDEGRESS